MYKVTSISPFGATLTTNHGTPESAAYEAITRERRQHTNIRSYEANEEHTDTGETCVQHGSKNKVQWARKTQGKVNVMNGGSL
jgi:hypothetical protein